MLSFLSLLLLIIPQSIWAGGYTYAPPPQDGRNGKDGVSSNRGQSGRSDGYKGRDDRNRGPSDNNKPDRRPDPIDTARDTDDDLICPFITEGTPVSGDDPSVPDIDTYNDILEELDEVEFINNVFQDIVDLLADSQECFPADTLGGSTNYGGLFIRLAWHCAGTFRATDGAGGCTGGRQRFPPEASWMDNVNLDKARAFLVPIKEKYGDALSWGDLMVFAGTASIYALGGPVNNICVGRIDEPDGSNSDVLGISGIPETADPPCFNQGDCNEDNDIIGASTVGLIYVNPEGVNGVPDPALSAPRIREIFGRMGNNDSETVALIGGGHAFGKCHGACPLGPGPNPEQQPFNPWPGLCGTGRGVDTFTSGIEGQWTTFPFVWDNEYFKLLRDDGFDYKLIRGPGGAYQWRNPNNGLLMLTTDLAFIYDDDFYEIVVNYANDLDALDAQFAAVWEKLTTSGGEFAREAFCIDASQLDLDLSEMPIQQNDYKRGGSRYKNRNRGNSYGSRGNDRSPGNDYGSNRGNDYGKPPQRNDYGAPQRSKPRNDGRGDDNRKQGGNDDGRSNPAPRGGGDYKAPETRGNSKYSAPRDNGSNRGKSGDDDDKDDNKGRVKDDRNREDDNGRQGGNSGSRGRNDYGSNGKSGSRPGDKDDDKNGGGRVIDDRNRDRDDDNRQAKDDNKQGSKRANDRGDDDKDNRGRGGDENRGAGNDRSYDNRGGYNGRDGADGKDGRDGGSSTKSYSYPNSGSYGGKKYHAQNEPDNIMIDQPSSNSYNYEYTSFIIIGIVTLVFNLIAYSLTYACCLNKNNVQSKPIQNKWI